MISYSFDPVIHIYFIEESQRFYSIEEFDTKDRCILWHITQTRTGSTRLGKYVIITGRE